MTNWHSFLSFRVTVTGDAVILAGAYAEGRHRIGIGTPKIFNY